MSEDPVAIKHWDKLLAWFPAYQYLPLNEQEQPIACGNAIPYWTEMTNRSLQDGMMYLKQVFQIMKIKQKLIPYQH